MADIATLGLKIDSSQATTAAKNLDGMAKSGNAATAAIGKLQNTSGPSFGVLRSAAQRAGVSIEEMRARMAKASETANVQSVALKKTATGHVQLAQASNTLTAAQIKTENTANNLAATLTKRFVAAYFVSQLKAMATAVAGLNAELAKTGDVGRVTGVGTQQIQGLQAAASNKGIDPAGFLDDMLKFNSQITLAKAGIGDMAALFRKNGVEVKDTGDAYAKVADMVKNAADYAAKESILRQAGLPATLQWVQLMEQGAAAIQKQSDEARKFTDAQLRRAKEIDTQFHELWTNFVREGKAAVLRVMDPEQWKVKISIDPDSPLAKLIALMDKGGRALFGDTPPAAIPSKLGGDVANSPVDPTGRQALVPPPAPSGKPTIDAATQKTIDQERISKMQQYLGLLGVTTTAEEARLGVTNQLDQAGINGVGIDSKRAEVLKQLAYENALGITAIKASADSYRVEADTIGMSAGQAEAYTAVQNKLNEAKRNGQVITDEQVTAIQREADAMGQAKQSLDNMRWSYDNLVNGPMQTFRSSIAQGASAMDAFKAAGISALDAISKKLMDMATENLWRAAFPGGGGGAGGLFKLFTGYGNSGDAGLSNEVGTGGFNVLDNAAGVTATVNHTGHGPGDKSPSRYVHPAYFDNAPRFHSGIGPGERPAIIRKDESVLTPGQMKQLSPNGGGANVYITNHNDFTGADPGSEARIKSYVDARSKQTVDEAVAAVEKRRATTPSYNGGRR